MRNVKRKTEQKSEGYTNVIVLSSQASATYHFQHIYLVKSHDFILKAPINLQLDHRIQTKRFVWIVEIKNEYTKTGRKGLERKKGKKYTGNE